MEAVQPSLVAKYSDVNTKGTAMGVYSTSQFLGIFVGGVIGGLILQKWGVSIVFSFGAISAALLLLVAITLPKPGYYKNELIRLKSEFLQDIDKTKNQLLEVKGIKQVAISTEERVAYLKIDKLALDRKNMDKFIY